MTFQQVLKKQYVAELIGTFGLTLLVSVMIMNNGADAVPFIAALTLAVFVYTIGGISGAHVNPAVTVGLWSIQKIKGRDAIGYCIAQVCGALIAMGVTMFLTGGTPGLVLENTALPGLGELLGAAFLVFGVCAVACGKVSAGASGATVGGSLLIGIFAASSVSHGILNPAVSIGIGSFPSVMYIFGPIVGGILSAQLYKWLSK